MGTDFCSVSRGKEDPGAGKMVWPETQREKNKGDERGAVRGSRTKGCLLRAPQTDDQTRGKPRQTINPQTLNLVLEFSESVRARLIRTTDVW